MGAEGLRRPAASRGPREVPSRAQATQAGRYVEGMATRTSILRVFEAKKKSDDDEEKDNDDDADDADDTGDDVPEVPGDDDQPADDYADDTGDVPDVGADDAGDLDPGPADGEVTLSLPRDLAKKLLTALQGADLDDIDEAQGMPGLPGMKRRGMY